MKALPKYIVEFVKKSRLMPCFFNDKNFVGYTFRFNQRFRTTEDGRFKRDLQRLIDYAKRNNADAAVLEESYRTNGGSRIWSAIVGITDPVALAIESERIRLTNG